MTVNYDYLGAPYVLASGPEFATEGAVEVPPFIAPQTEGNVGPSKNRQGRGWAEPGSGTDWPLSHATQQTLATVYAREHTGFDDLVKFSFTSDLGTGMFYYNAQSGAWREEQK